MPPKVRDASFNEVIESALQCLGTGRFSEAETICRQALAVSRDSAELYKTHGNALLSLGRLEEAEQAYRHALQLKSDYAEAYNNLGNVLRLSDRLEEAERMFIKALELMPGNGEVHNNFGNVLMDLGRTEEAEQVFHKAAVLNPAFPMAYFNRGNALRAIGRLEAAEKCYGQAIALKPDYTAAYIALGQALFHMQRLDEAEQAYRRALGITPNSAEAYIDLGNTLHYSGRLDEAEQAYRRALDLKPDFAEAHNGLGNVHLDSGRTAEAELAYRKALALKKDYATAKFNFSMLLLMLGSFEEGFELFEQRFDGGSPKSFASVKAQFMRLCDCKRWDGEPLAEKSLLIITEQGAGDSLMMMRYLPLLKQWGLERLVVSCGPHLKRVFQSMPAVDGVVSPTESSHSHSIDFYCPIMSLPHLLQAPPDAVPVPYVGVPEQMRHAWRSRLAGEPGLKVGLVWAGNNQHVHDKRRSIPLALFSPLVDVKGVRLVSVQKGEAREQLKTVGWNLPDWMDACDDFMDTAALVDGLDLVISVDTAVAHLAGALGKPVWLLNRFESEWRWMLDRENSPWYPSMRIFRQKSRGDWEPVMSLVAEELARLAK